MHAGPARSWLCVGDFNEILFSHENRRQRSKPKLYGSV
jgi:hypothetical protein